MKLKYMLSIIVIISALIVGCSNRIEQESALNNEAIKQRTMTILQNNVNEIIGKDYDYVLQNLGKPYCTTYYIDLEKIDLKSLPSIKDGNYITNHVRLVYPKENVDQTSEESAIYIDIINDKVKEVQTYEFTQEDIKKEYIEVNADIIIDKYDTTPTLSLSDALNIDSNKYIGKEISEFESESIFKDTNFEVYDKNRNDCIMAYILSDSTDKVLIAIEKNKKIEEVKVVNLNSLIKVSVNNLASKK